MRLTGRAQLLMGPVSVIIYGVIAAVAWEGPRWISYLATFLGAWRALLWLKQVRRLRGEAQEEEPVESQES